MFHSQDKLPGRYMTAQKNVYPTANKCRCETSKTLERDMGSGKRERCSIFNHLVLKQRESA